MFCAKCGTEVSDGSSFCAKCGESVGSTPKTGKPGKGMQSVGWLCVVAGLASVFAPMVSQGVLLDAILPFLFLAFPFLWFGFAVVFGGSSWIVRMGKGFAGAVAVMAVPLALNFGVWRNSVSAGAGGSFGSEALPATAEAAAPTKTAAVVPAANPEPQTKGGLASVVRTASELVVPRPDGSSHGWEELSQRWPAAKWSEQTDDKDFAVVRSADLPEGLKLTFKGARTMVLAGEVSVQRAEDAQLLPVVESALSPTLARCDSEESPMSVERWYRLNAAKPVVAHYVLSSGSGGNMETLTFDTNADSLPAVGSDAVTGKWTDRCPR